MAEYGPDQSSIQRAWQNTEDFRQSAKSFYGVEIIVATLLGLGGGFFGYSLTPEKASNFAQYAYPTVGGVLGIILGLAFVFFTIFAWYLFQAPYRQRNEARIGITKIRETFQEKIDSLQKIVNNLQEARPSIKLTGLNNSKEIRWRIDNRGGSAEFRASGQQVNEKGLLLDKAWPIRWERSEEEFKKINSGDHAVLEIATIGWEPVHPGHSCIRFNTAKFISDYGRSSFDTVYSNEIDMPSSLSRINILITITSDKPLREPCESVLTIYKTDDDRIEVELPKQ